MHNISIYTFINTPIPSNCFVVVDDATHHCIVVDPGSKEETEVVKFILEKKLFVDYIFLTHEHMDHVWGTNSILQNFDVSVICTGLASEIIKKPTNIYNRLYYNCNQYYSIDKVPVKIEDLNYRLDWNGLPIVFSEAKGHTAASMIFTIGDVLFSGDTMILNTEPYFKKRSGSSIVDYYKTISFIYNTYPSNTVVYPGHGECFELLEMDVFYKNYFAKNSR